MVQEDDTEVVVEAEADMVLVGDTALGFDHPRFV